MRYRISFLALLVSLLLNTPASATDPSDEKSPDEMAREGMEQMLRALEKLIDTIPQYELPEINDEGDIIIRRKPAPSREATEPKPEFEETST